jgi:hypothetical protein
MRLPFPVLLATASLALTLGCPGTGSQRNDNKNAGNPDARRNLAEPLTCKIKGGPSGFHWLAVQDGNGPWTAVNPVNQTFTFTLTQATGAVAGVLTSPATGRTTVNLIYGSAQTLAKLAGMPEDPGPSDLAVRGSFAGVHPDDSTFITLNDGHASAPASCRPGADPGHPA